MALDSFEKQPSEKFVISGSFAGDLDDGESLVLGLCSVVAVDTDNNVATTDVLDLSTFTLEGTSKLKVQVKDGEESKSAYKITFKGVTDATPSNLWELDITMVIKEK